jgi:hypothetical protein
MQKNNKRTKQMGDDDAGRTKISDVVPEKPLEIISLALDNKGTMYGLGNNGKVYRYVNDNREWVLI